MIGATDSLGSRDLRAFAALGSVVLVSVYQHTGTAYPPPPADTTDFRPRPFRTLTLTSAMCEPIPELPAEGSENHRAPHWQKHDRLPFYHGIKSRRNRK